MFRVSIDMSDIERMARSLQVAEDQIPYAASVALNAATEVTRTHLIKTTWPSHIKQRNSTFLAAALTTKGSRATKGNLTSEIYDRLGRAHLSLHAKGGTRVGSGMLAVPTSKVPRTARGVAQRLRPRNLANSVRIKDAIYTRDRRGRLKLMYVLKATTKVPKRVPFYEDYERVMRTELMRALPAAFAKAMATRRVR